MNQSKSIAVVMVVASMIICTHCLFSPQVQSEATSNVGEPGPYQLIGQPRSEFEWKLLRFAKELEDAAAYFAEGHVEGLLALLASGRPTTKLRACRYLEELGAHEALEPISQQLALCRGTVLADAMRVSYDRLMQQLD